MAKSKEYGNLIPQNMRTKDEQRRIAIEGGKASGEARRRKKTLKESMETLLSLPISNKQDFNRVIKMGIDLEDMDNSQLIVLALFNKAKDGDVSAIKELRDLIDEKVLQTEQTQASKLDAKELKTLAEQIMSERRARK